MQGRFRQDQSSHGCFYVIRDYGSMSRRALVLLVDMAVCLVVPALAFLIAVVLGLGDDAAFAASAATALVFVYLYFVELERSRVRTLGLRMTGLEVVNLNGTPPNRMDMITRLGMMWLGPANLLVDLFWIPSDSNRQALRDKFAGTYVIKNGCAPAGYGDVKYARYFFLGMNWVFREVARPGASDKKANSAA
jgi:uncharacterized RDD family membrane protein YckC